MKMIKWLSAIKWTAIAVAVVALVWLVMKWSRTGGIAVDAGFDSRIELTAREIRRLEQIGQWEFLSVRTEVVADTLRKGFISDDRLVAVYTGEPRLGIDMNRVDGEWVRPHGDTVTLRLPAVHLLDKNFIDEARTRVFYENGKWPNTARRDLYDRAYRKMLRQCLSPSNIQRAETHARNQFAAMFRAMGFHTVEIVFIK